MSNGNSKKISKQVLKAPGFNSNEKSKQLEIYLTGMCKGCQTPLYGRFKILGNIGMGWVEIGVNTQCPSCNFTCFVTGRIIF